MLAAFHPPWQIRVISEEWGVLFVDAWCWLLAQLAFPESDYHVICDTLSASKSVSAFTEQPAPMSESENVPIPQELWTVLILCVILFVLLAWRAIDEMLDGSGGDDNGSSNGTWFPPLL
jgi:hypothetical protein